MRRVFDKMVKQCMISSSTKGDETMFDEIDRQESKWRRILSRPIHPDDAPPVDEDDEDDQDAQAQE